MEIIFQIPDYGGTPVSLGKREWEDKILSSAPTGHPEVAEYLDAIKKSIANPDIVFESSRRTDCRIFYCLNVGKGAYAGKHLVIVVKDVQEEQGLRGYVSTVYLARGVHSKGRLLWRSKSLPMG